MSFDRLLDLNLTHDYYQGTCPDLRIEPSPETSRWLSAAAIKVQSSPGSLTLHFQKDDQGNPLRSLDGQRLLLAIVVVNPVFSVFTNLAGADNSQPLYRNSPDPLSLAPPRAYQQVPGRFTYPVQLDDRPTTIRLTDHRNRPIEQHSLGAENPSTELSLLLDKYGPGFYRIKESIASDSTETDIANLPWLPPYTIALVELTITPIFYTQAPSFNIHYGARNDTLNYYVVAQNYSDTEFDHLQLADAGFAEQSRAEISFTRVESNNFTEAHTDAALLHGGGSKVVLFHSQTDVSRRQHGPKKLQLRLGGEVLIASLPTPGRNSVTADFFINVAKA
ncbi:hypothetical protein [Motiliproteus sp.]|uniref:hypothetical protein n=1 Tax=Motiliproteus sp. TaxID=1898955 RepID=UPI003BA90944